MVCYKAAVILGLFLCISVRAGELELSGHETPLYVGLSRIITCTWTGSENITELDWYLVGLGGLGLGMKLDDHTTALNPGRVTDISWNGKRFMCRATTTSGTMVVKTFALWVKELGHEIKIAPLDVPCEDNSHSLMAGDDHILTCTVNSELPANLKWIRIINKTQVEVDNTTTITVSAQIISDRITNKSITFKPLLTSHAGVYKCISVLNNMGPKALSTKELEHPVKIKIPSPCVELKSDNEAVTSKNFALTAFIEVHPAVDTPTDIDSSWYGHLSLEDAPRVTISNTLGKHPSYDRSVQFTPLISSDDCTYSFSARVMPLDSEYLCPSSYISDSIDDISPSLFVTIGVAYARPADFNLEYPPNYKINTDVTLTCQAEGASGNVKYQWLSTAERDLPANSNSQNLTKTMLNSYDTGNYTCMAMDANSNIGSATTEMKVIGLLVNINVEYDPSASCTLPSSSPPYFSPAASVNLTCHVEGASGPFSYKWSSTGLSSFVVKNSSSILRRAILTSDDAGNHTCNVIDDEGNTGSSTIEMKMKGGGIFVVESRYHKNVSLTNNSVVNINSRIIDFVCYTNSSDSDDGYIILPDNMRYYDTEQIHRISPSGIQFQNNNNRLPVYTGIYTCRLPDSNGKIIDLNLGVYTSARAPYIYYYEYIDQSKNESNILFGVIEIRTRYSPPTNITCKRDREIVIAPHTCNSKDGYEVMQVITDRYRSYYTTYIQIRNACDLIGKNVYTCTVENSAGSHSRAIHTNMEVKTDLSLKNTTEPVYNDTFILKCTATFTPPKPARYLVQQPIIEWVGPDGNVLNNSDSIIVGEQIALQNEATKTLTFSSLKYPHEGLYICRSKCVESTPQSFTIKVIERTILQLKFGPLPHCSNWYQEKQISAHVERDLRRAIEGILLKSCNNSCTLHHRLLTGLRFSCRTSTSCVTFRATLIGSQDTMRLHDMLIALTKWLEADGTFLYNYNSRIRLRADRECPLTINSFYDPEYEGRECLFQHNTTTMTVNHHTHTRLFI